MSIELWTLDGPEQTEDVIALFRFAIGAAHTSEIIHPETATALRQWCNIEYAKLYPSAPRVSPEEEVRASLQRSPWFTFWTTLQAGQEVRWTGTRTSTYFVVDPELQANPSESYGRQHTAYIKLRRHSGKEFWTHVGKVRPA